jgi:predicted amidohydrolase YtcJ
LIALLVACRTPAPPAADLLVVADQLIEVEGGRIRAVHAPESGAPVAIGPATRVMRAGRVTAGFVDAHAHPDGLGAHLASLDLTGADSYAETLERVQKAPTGEGWLVGRGWDQNDWPDAPEGGWPLASDLQKIQPGRKIVLERVDGHATWVSPAVLQELGLTRDTPDPADGRILRDPSGAPQGVLVDGATRLVQPPPPTAGEERRRMQSALVLIAAKGLTGVHMMGCSDGTLALLEELASAGKLPVRLWVYVDPTSQAASKLLAQGPWGQERLHVVGIKAYADGALGSRGALLSEPYADEPQTRGTALTTPEALRELAIRTLGAGGQLAVHAIGDLAVRHALDAFEAARAAHPERSALPLRLEHAQVVAPTDIPRLRALNVIASMQPTHAVSDSPWAEQRLGPSRIAWSYAWRTMLESGAVLAFGSDFPVEAVDPALGVAAATTRGGWRVEQALTVAETVAAFTSGAALAVGEEELGVLEAGMLADLTLWGDDGAGHWRATATVVGGEVVAGASP